MSAQDVVRPGHGSQGDPAPPPRMGPETPGSHNLTHVSWTQAEVYAGCGEKWRLQYVERVPQEPQGALLGGRAIHETIVFGYHSGWADAEELPQAVWDHYAETFTASVTEAGGPEAVRWGGRKSREFPGGEDINWWVGREPEAMLRRAHDTVRQDATDGLRLFNGDAGIEVEVGATTGSGTPTRSFVDRLLVNADGELGVDDWKTGKPGGGSKMQLGLYAWAVKEALGLDVTWGGFTYLRASDTGRRHEVVDLAPLVPLVAARLDAFERGVAAGVFQLIPSNFCKSCGVRAHCAYGKTLGGNVDG